MHKNKKCKIVNLRSLSFVTTARGMALVTSKGLRQLKKKSKLTTFYTKKKKQHHPQKSKRSTSYSLCLNNTRKCTSKEKKGANRAIN